MAFFSHNLIHTVYLQVPAATRDVHGDPTSAGTQTSASAKVDAVAQLVRTQDAREVVAAHKIHLDTEVTFGTRIWIPLLGDDIAEAGDARHPLSIVQTESVRGGQTLWIVYL